MTKRDEAARSRRIAELKQEIVRRQPALLSDSVEIKVAATQRIHQINAELARLGAPPGLQ